MSGDEDRRSRGFTLIETLVALGVFAIAALALLRLEGATVATTARLQDRQIGQLVARGVAFAALTDPVPPAIGEQTGGTDNGGRAWRWTRNVARVGEGPMIRIDVAVRDVDDVPAGAMTMYRNGG